MNHRTVFSTFGMHMISGCLIISVSYDIDDETALHLQRDVLENVKTTGAKKVLFNVSALQVLGGQTFSILRDTAHMIAMLGASTIFVGFQAGVASALVDLDVPVEDIRTAITMEEGMVLLESEIPVSGVDDDADALEDASGEAGSNEDG